jgi:hypothetical protein
VPLPQYPQEKFLQSENAHNLILNNPLASKCFKFYSCCIHTKNKIFLKILGFFLLGVVLCFCLVPQMIGTTRSMFLCLSTFIFSYCKYNLVWHKIICKRFTHFLNLLNLLKIKLPTCEKMFIFKIIGSLLQIQNPRFTLHAYFSIIVIHQLLFFELG